MKRLLTVVSVPLLLLSSLNTYATGVGVLDMEKVFASSPQVKTINADLKSQFADKKKSLDAMGQTLQTDMQNYQKNKSVMSKESLTALEQKIVGEQRSLQQAGIQFQKDVYAAQSTKTKAFLNQVKDVVKTIAIDKKLDIVLPKGTLLYSNSSLDVTPDVIKALQTKG